MGNKNSRKISKYMGRARGSAEYGEGQDRAMEEGEHSESAFYACMKKVTMKCINCITHAKENYQNEKNVLIPIQCLPYLMFSDCGMSTCLPFVTCPAKTCLHNPSADSICTMLHSC